MTTHRINSQVFRAILPMLVEEDCHPFPYYAHIGLNQQGAFFTNGFTAVQLPQHFTVYQDPLIIDPRTCAAQSLMFDSVNAEATPAESKTAEFFKTDGTIATQMFKTVCGLKNHRRVTINAHYLKQIAELAIALAEDNEAHPHLTLHINPVPPTDRETEFPIVFQLKDRGCWEILMNAMLMPLLVRKRKPDFMDDNDDFSPSDSEVSPEPEELLGLSGIGQVCNAA